jgi:hypothetical protein
VDFDGVNDKLTSLVTGDAWVTDAQGLILALFNADTAAADAGGGVPYMNPAIQSMQGSGTIIMGYSAAGLRAACYDGAYKEDPAVAASTSAWHLGKIYWDSSTLKQDVDSGTAASTPAGILTAGGASYKFQFGSNYNASAFFNGRIAVLAAAKVIPSAGNFLKLRATLNQQWGTTL